MICPKSSHSSNFSILRDNTDCFIVLGGYIYTFVHAHNDTMCKRDIFFPKKVARGKLSCEGSGIKKSSVHTETHPWAFGLAQDLSRWMCGSFGDVRIAAVDVRPNKLFRASKVLKLY